MFVMKKSVFVFLLLLTPLFVHAQMSNEDCFFKVLENVPELEKIDTKLRTDTYDKNYLDYNVIHCPSIFNNFTKVYLKVVFKSGLKFKEEYEYLQYWAIDPYRGNVYSWNPETFVLTELEQWKYLNNSH